MEQAIMSDTTSEVQTADIERLADIILNLQHCFMMGLSEQLARGQVSFSQFFLLGHITHESLSMTVIAKRMNHTTAAATGIVDRLAKFGYVQRVAAENDRRKVFVKITSKGTDLVDSIRQDIIKNLSQIMSLLPPQDQKAWLRIYERMQDYCQDKQCPQ